MSPVAVMSSQGPFSSPSPGIKGTPQSATPALDIARRPSPWHDLSHSLSETSLPPRRGSSPQLAAVGQATSPSPPLIGHGTPSLSTSQALREWEDLLSQPDTAARRHQLVHRPSMSTPSRSPTPSITLLPKLAAERDKEGHIEYKLKLIEPSPERFDRLVTQMMWRLKQGRNEAIYEIGLADDGTVIGLTRAEMDASLRTLELMASEIGATVLVLKEIVIAGTAANRHGGSLSASVSSSAISLSSGYSAEQWFLRRPDLDELGRPRKGTKSYTPSDDTGSKHSSPIPNGNPDRARLITRPSIEELSSPPSSAASGPGDEWRRRSEEDADVPVFHLDFGDSLPAGVDQKKRKKKKKKSKGNLLADKVAIDNDPELRAEKERKAAEKEARLRKRVEQRRLDLLRGDGTSPLWLESQAAQAAAVPSLQPFPRLPHQPARPSSLRLATPVSSSPEDNLLSLLHQPLDSLSLSFADVRTVTADSPPSSPSSETEYALPLSSPTWDSQRIAPIAHEDEMICVEALVVRKAHREENEGEEWTWGGAEDMWGLGADEDLDSGYDFGYEVEGDGQASIDDAPNEGEDEEATGLDSGGGEADAWGFAFEA